MTPELQQKIFEMARKIEQLSKNAIVGHDKYNPYYNHQQIIDLAESIQSLTRPDVMNDIPFFAVGDEELKGAPSIKEGDLIEHRHEDGTWETATIEYGEKVLENGDKVKSDILAFYKLANGHSYLAGIAGKMVSSPSVRKKKP